MPAAHQVPAGIFTGADKIPSCFLLYPGNLDRSDLTEFEQPGQVQGILRIGLDPVPGGARWSFDGAATTASIPADSRNLAKPKSVGPAS